MIWQAFKNHCVVLRYGNWFCAMAHSAQPNAAPRPLVLQQILRYGPQRITKSCARAIAHTPNPALWPIARKSSQIFMVWLHSTQWLIAHNQFCRSGRQRITKFAVVAHCAQPNSPQWPIAHNKFRQSGPQHGRNSEVKFLGKFESIFETAIDHESGDQLGTFGEITLEKKSHATVPLIH